MRSLLNFALLSMAAIRSVSSGKTLVVSNIPQKKTRDQFNERFSSHFLENEDKVSHLENPSDLSQIISALNQEYDAIAFQAHGNEAEIPEVDIYGNETISLCELIERINSANKTTLNQIHISSCYIGQNVNQLLDSDSGYYHKLNQNMENNQLLFLHGDEYTGVIGGSYVDRLPHLIENKEYSIIEALIDSGEGLTVVLKQEDQLKVFTAKSFGRNGEKWTVENYRNYLNEVAAKAKEFEVENNILAADAKRPNISELSDKELNRSMGDVFGKYCNKLLDAKDFDKIYEIIGNTPNLNLQDKDGWTLLIRASNKGYSDIVDFLITSGADSNLQDKNGQTALIHSVNQNHIDIVRYLIEKGVDLNRQDKNGRTAFMIAIGKIDESNNVDILETLLAAKGLNLDLQDDSNWTALTIAIEKRAPGNLVLDIIRKGANVNLQEKDGWTASMFASTYKYFNSRVLKALIENGANLDLQNKDGDTALIIAINNDENEAVSYLIEKVSNLDLQNKNGNTALMLAAKKRDYDIVASLIKKGANPNLKNNIGLTALKITFDEGYIHIANLLIKSGSDVSVLDDNILGKIFSSKNLVAARDFLLETAYMLQEKGITVPLTQDFLEKSFVIAAHNGKSNWVQFLVEKGIEIDGEKELVLLNEIDSNPKQNANLAKFLDADKIKSWSEESEIKKEALAWVALEFLSDGDFEKAKLLINKIILSDSSKKNLRGEKPLDFLNYQDSKGYSLLMYAAQNGDEELFDSLLENGAEVSLLNNEGESAYSIAKKNHHETIAERIKSFHEKTGGNYNPEIMMGSLAAIGAVASAAILKLKGDSKDKNIKTI